MRRVIHGLSVEPREEATRALQLLEMAEDLWTRRAGSETGAALITRSGHLTSIAKAAFAAGRFNRAAVLANKVLELETRLESIGPSSDTLDGSFDIHTAHIVLGKIALQRGDLAAADNHLLASATVSGYDGVLRTLGPDVDLANRLIQAGHIESVVSYLTSCRRFWIMGQELVDDWIRALSAGERPALDKQIWRKTRRFGDVIRVLKSP